MAEAQPASPRHIAKSIGRYRVDSAIGEGAMADVYLAYDPGICRFVAIKVLKPELRHDANVVARFLAESRAAGVLSHPNIVTIHDVGQADGVPYIAMEHLDGEPLDRVLERDGRMPFERVIALAVQVTSALVFAHANGVVHRDIKPSNILICDNGKQVKLLDFGIARVDGCEDGGVDRTAQTQVGQIIGTPRYMSPEQALGLPVDARTDLFSLGAVLHEMLTGRPAFAANGLAALAIQIAQDAPVKIRDQIADCPRGLAFAIEKLLSKKPSDRFVDARSLARALEKEVEALKVEGQSAKRGLRLGTKLPLTLAATAAVALVMSAVMVDSRQTSTLERMGLATGSSMTEFVARNAALSVAENAGLPPAEQDWTPLQAFVAATANDHYVHNIVIADSQGVIRAASRGGQVGSRFEPSSDVARSATGAVLARDGFHFVRPIRYAGAEFGHVAVELDRSRLDAAVSDARFLLAGLSAFVILVVTTIGYLSARKLSQPLRRLKRALLEVADGSEAEPLSHRRTDEIGGLYDAFNQMVARLENPGAGPSAGADALSMTRIEPAGYAAPSKAA